jgi:hypothetical protein
MRRSAQDIEGPLLEECAAALRERYYQYRGVEFADLLLFDVESLAGWAAGEA